MIWSRSTDVERLFYAGEAQTVLRNPLFKLPILRHSAPAMSVAARPFRQQHQETPEAP
jgi:hypothetical protein